MFGVVGRLKLRTVASQGASSAPFFIPKMVQVIVQYTLLGPKVATTLLLGPVGQQASELRSISAGISRIAEQ